MLTASIRYARLCVSVLVTVSLVQLTACSSAQSKRDRYLSSGKNALSAKDYTRAALEFRNAAQAMPKDPEAYYQLALISLAWGDIRGGAAMLRLAIERGPKHVAARLKLADLMASGGDPELLREAETSLRDVLATAPGDPEALNTLAISEFKLGRAEEAEASLQEALDRAPTYLRTYVNLANLALSRNQLPAAEKVLKQATEAAPSSWEAWDALGRFYLLQSKPAEAEAQFRRGVQADPKSARMLHDLARILFTTGKFDEAEGAFRQLSAFPDPGFRSIHAQFLLRRGDQAGAIKELEQLFDHDSKDRAIRTQLIEAYLSTKRTGDAETLLTRALKKNHRDEDALLQRSQIYIVRGKLDQAEADLRNVLHTSSNSAAAHYALAHVHRARNAAELERQELGEAVRLNPELLGARVDWARSLLASRSFKAALDLLNAAPDYQKNTLPLIVQRNWALLGTPDYAAARKGIDTGLGIAKVPEFLFQDAVLQLHYGKTARARQLLYDALKLDPTDIRALDALVSSYAAANENANAVQAIKEYAARRPDNVRLQLYAGDRLLIVGDLAAARSAFEAAKKTGADNGSADAGLAQLVLKAGNGESARKMLRTVVEAYPANSVAARNLGSLEEQAGRYPEAIAAYKRAVENDAKDWVSMNNLAWCLSKIAQHDDALKYAQQARQIEPENPYVIAMLGWAYYNKGLYASAVKQLELIRKDDTNATRRYWLAMAYFRNGNLPRGMSTLDAALKLNPNLPEAVAAQQVANEASAAPTH
jgi:tetratricopeptide (TPR) repeat protein